MVRRTAVVIAFVLAALAMPASRAGARANGDFAWTWDQVWGATVRMVRVDMGCPIRERDEEIGFVLFDYVDGNRTYPGSVELVRSRVDGREQIRVVVQIPAMPSYIEQMIVDRLQRKLQADFGDPPPAPPRRTEEPRERQRERDGAREARPTERDANRREPTRPRDDASNRPPQR